jgi:hypothetical protein
MYFLYCLFLYPKKLAFKNHQTDQTWQQPCYVCFDGRRFTTRQGSRFRTGDETPASEADSEATSLVCVAEAIRGSSGVGGWNSHPGLANCLAYDGSIWIYMDLWTKIYKQLHQLWWSKRWQQLNFHTLQAHDTAAMARSAQSVGWECGSLASRVSDSTRVVGLLW